jgi:hypothetical protein
MECIQNFGGEISWKMVTWNTKKDNIKIGLREMGCG